MPQGPADCLKPPQPQLPQFGRKKWCCKPHLDSRWFCCWMGFLGSTFMMEMIAMSLPRTSVKSMAWRRVLRISWNLGCKIQTLPLPKNWGNYSPFFYWLINVRIWETRKTFSKASNFNFLRWFSLLGMVRLPHIEVFQDDSLFLKIPFPFPTGAILWIQNPKK